MEGIPSAAYERAPTVQASVHRGFPSQRSQVIVFPEVGWITGAP